MSMCCDDAYPVTPRVSALAGCDRGYRVNYYGRNSRNWCDRQPRDDNRNSQPREDNPSIPLTTEKSIDESDFEKTMREFMFLKDLVSNKSKMEQIYAAFLNEECSAIVQNKLPPKLGDPRSFLIPCTLANSVECLALTDLGASINLIPYSLYTQIDINRAAGGNLKGLSAEEAWETIEDYAYDEPIGDLDMMEDKVDNPSPQSTPQVLPSFEVYTPPVTYPQVVEETLGTPMEVEPLEETQLENLLLNTHNHDIPLSSREVPIFDEPKPQPQPLLNCPSLDASLGNERGPGPPIKPPSPDSFRMKEVDHLTIYTLSSPYVASFHLKDTYCYYHPHIDDPKKHYGFKPGLLGQSESLGVDFSNMEMIEDDCELEHKEVSFLGRRLNLPIRPKEVENVIFDKKKLGSSYEVSLDDSWRTI
ncbi:hypothetical protein Tco_0214082 [Tanacetum coccineum]